MTRMDSWPVADGFANFMRIPCEMVSAYILTLTQRYVYIKILLEAWGLGL